MGTNYYLVFDPCPHCHRSDERWHIGKSSYGWCFSLHVEPDVRDFPASIDEWVAEWLKDGREIRDEYGDLITPQSMIDTIQNRTHSRDPRTSWKFGDYYKSFEDFLAKNHAELGPNNLLRHKVDGRHCIGHGSGTWDLITGEFS